MNECKEWLKSLKKGDFVVRSYGHGHRSLSLNVISRATATQIIVGGERFHRTTGQKVGGNSSVATVRLLEPTAERTTIIRMERLQNRLARTNWRSLPLETLEAVYALLPKERP